MLQAAVGNSLSFDPFPFCQNGWTASAIDIGWGEIVGALVTAISMAAAGYGVVLGPESMHGLGFPELVFQPLADFAEKVELAVAFRTAEPSASVRAFIDAAVALGKRRELDASPGTSS